MRRRLQRGQDNAEVNMTPMLDIVFILLIFFIVTATFLQESGVNMAPPPPSENEAPPNPTPSILVTVDANDLVYVNARITDVERVQANIQRQIVENRGDSAVQIRPHIDATHGVVTRVYDAAGRSGAVAVIVRDPEAF